MRVWCEDRKKDGERTTTISVTTRTRLDTGGRGTGKRRGRGKERHRGNPLSGPATSPPSSMQRWRQRDGSQISRSTVVDQFLWKTFRRRSQRVQDGREVTALRVAAPRRSGMGTRSRESCEDQGRGSAAARSRPATGAIYRPSTRWISRCYVEVTAESLLERSVVGL